MGQHLEGFTQTHFIGENASEAVVTQEANPSHTVFLVGAQDRLERPERWTGLSCRSCLLGDTISPGCGRLDRVPLFPQRCVEEPGLGGSHAVPSVALVGRAVEQHFLQLFHRAGVDQDRLSGAGFALAPAEHQPLDVGRTEALAVFGHVGDLEVEPTLPRGRDLESGFHAHQVLAGAGLEAFLQRHLPLAFQSWVKARKVGQHAFLTVELPAPLGIGAREAGLPETHEGRVFGGQVPSRVAPDVGRVGHPGGLVARGDAHGHDAGAVAALQQGRQHGQASGQLEQELRRGRFEHKVFRAEIRLQARSSGEFGPVLGEKAGDIRSRYPLGRLQHSSQGGGQAQWLECLAGEQPGFIGSAQQSRSLGRTLQAQADFAIGFELSAQGQGRGLSQDRQLGLAPEGELSVPGHGPQQRHEGGSAELDHARSIPAGGQFGRVEQSHVGFGQSKRSRLN